MTREAVYRQDPVGHRVCPCPICRVVTPELYVKDNYMGREAVFQQWELVHATTPSAMGGGQTIRDQITRAERQVGDLYFDTASKRSLAPLPAVCASTSLSVSQYYGLLHLFGDSKIKLVSLYRSSIHGNSYGDLLFRVGNKKGLVFIIHKEQTIFGCSIGGGLQLPGGTFGGHRYASDVWHFSLAGHYTRPTKIEMPRADQFVFTTGTVKNVASAANVVIGVHLSLGDGGVGNPPAGSICECRQYTCKHNLPDGYRGERDRDGDAVLGGAIAFTATEIEVLHVTK